ncbi:MAG: hypothetical protein JRH20_04545 [Deltaproteobacteria bacterium]|nr:hypothetical protein [Deltaproteobacteria bacterium]
MKKASLCVVVALAISILGFGCGSDGSECDLPPGNWSTANTGSMCQVNFFGEVDYAVYCADSPQGGYNCACGAVSENPPEFTSADLCDLEPEARACAAISACSFPL